MYRRTKIHQNGFSLLEAIVALVLLASTGLALYSWINTNLITLNRVARVVPQSHAVQLALNYMVHVNPTKQPNGTEELGGWTLEWESIIATPLQQGMGYPRGTSFYQVGLYEITVSVRDDSHTLATFLLHKIGYQQTRNPVTPL